MFYVLYSHVAAVPFSKDVLKMTLEIVQMYIHITKSEWLPKVNTSIN